MFRHAVLIFAVACTPPVVEPARVGVVATVPASGGFVDRFDEPATIELQVAPEAADALRERPREWVDGRVWIDGVERDAEVRLKGNGSFRPFDDRPSFKVRLDPPLAGIRTLILNNTVSDSTRIAERAARAAYATVGVPVARAGHAWVSVEGVPRGLYTVLEDVDTRFLARHYDDASGSLYEMENADFLVERRDGFEHEQGPTADEALDQVTAALALGNAVGFAATEPWIDHDAFFDYLAVSAWVGQSDAYPYSTPGDDTYLYRDPLDGRFDFLPHGLDESFQDRGRTLDRITGLLARRCVVESVCRARLRERVESVGELLASDWLPQLDDLVLRSAEWGRDERLRWDGEGAWVDRTEALEAWFDTRGPQLLAELPE